MTPDWTPWARDRLLPLLGEAWTPVVELKTSEKRLAKAGAVVPATLDVEAEVDRGRELRLHHRYAADGNHPRDKHGRDLVDVWVSRAGVVTTTEILVAIAQTRAEGHRFMLRHDGQPWGRLREHLAAAPAGERDAAHAIAATVRSAAGELPQAVAYAFCDPAWVADDLAAALEAGYGQLALLAALSSPAQARQALEVLTGPDATRYQIVEEGYPHVPTLMRRLDAADADLIVTAAAMAWNKATRKPWLEIVGCLATPAAAAFLAEHAAEPARKPAAKARPTRR